MNQNVNSYLVTERISKLLFKFSIPCIMSLLVSSLYNIVDQIFIGRGVGYLGNGATNVVYPITVIALAVAIMIGDGCAAYLSLCQGKKDLKSANKSVGNAVTLLIGIGIIMALLFGVFKGQILSAFGVTENNFVYANEYFKYIVIGIPFFVIGSGVNSIIRADGSPQFAMFTTLIGCIINVILDPIAIFVLGLGMKGAALATILGQIVTAIVGLGYLTKAKSINLSRDSFVPSIPLIGRFLSLGISSFITQISIVVIMGVMNNVLVKYGAQSKYGADIPLTTVGIVMKVFGIVVALVIGIVSGSQPIVGYNYGAGEFKRVRKLFLTIVKVEAIVGLVAFICFEVFPLQITAVFGSEDGLYNEFAVLSFRIFLSMIVFTCVTKSVGVFLQALGKPVMSLGISVFRDFVLSIPLAIILPKYFGIKGVLLSGPIADIGAMIVAVFISAMILKELKKEENGATNFVNTTKDASEKIVRSRVCIEE